MRWTAAALAVRQGLVLLTVAVLARLLDPSDFGLMAMALVVVGFASLFRDAGITASIIQRPSLDEGFASGQFWLALGIGALIGALVFLTAPLLADMYVEPELVPILRAVSPVFVVAAAGSVPQALLERRLAFSRAATAEISAAFAASACAIGIAVLGGGVWSLVAQAVVTAVLATVLYFWLARWRPELRFSRQVVRTATSFGSAVTSFNVSNYVARNADYFIIGRTLGSEQLGFYTAAYRLMLIPVQVLNGAFGRVLFPIMSHAQDNEPVLRLTYLRALGAITFLAFPLGVLLAVTAHRLVPLFLGPGWGDSVPVLQVLAFVGIGQSVGATVGPIWLSKGRVGEMAAYGVVGAIIVVTGFAVGVQFGIVGVAVSYLLTSTFGLTLPSMALALRHIGLTVPWTLKTLWRQATSAILIGVAVVLTDAFVGSVSDLIALVIDLGVAATVFVATSLTLGRKHLLALLSFLGLAKSQRSAASPGGSAG